MGTTLSQLLSQHPASAFDGSEIIEVTQGGTSKGGTLNQVKTFAAGSGLALTSYQNSAMSVPVQAYVFKDVNDNIVRVYEPLGNNDVSRNQFAYADSIDLFPFDNTEWYDCKFSDTALVGLMTDTVIRSATLENMTVDAGSNANFRILNHIHKGLYGYNGTEISVAGINVLIENSNCYYGVIQDLGTACHIQYVTMDSEAEIQCDSKSNIAITYGRLGSQASINCTKNGGTVNDFVAEASSYILLGSSEYNQLRCGVSSIVGDFNNNNSFHSLFDVDVSTEVSLVPATDDNLVLTRCNFLNTGLTVPLSVNKTDKNYINDGGTVYELGVTAGAVTAIAV